MRQTLFNSESGVILLVVIILMLALTITGLAFLSAGVMENSLARREIHKNQAFYLAEAGLEQTLWNLKQDFENGNRDWTDNINGILVEETENEWKVLQYGDPPHESPLGAGFYVVRLKYADDGAGGLKTDEIWVKSTGIVKGVLRTVQVYVKMGNLSPWNNAIFAGIGAGAGTVINGNSLIHGSVLILGAELEPEAMVMDMLGNAGIRNNYEGMPDGSGGTVNLVAKVPQCPTTTFNGETVESLDAHLRVKRGQVVLGGTATVGENDIFGNSFKEMMDGVYVTDGFDLSGTAAVHSDNGIGNPYDLGDTVEFPSLRESYVDPLTGIEYDTYLDYLKGNSLHITEEDGTPISEISSNVDSFARGTPGENYINWDKDSALLIINGIIYVDADSLDLGKKNETIEYSGNGTIVVAEKDGESGILGQIIVHGDLLAEGTYTPEGGGFPNNVLGLITGKLDLGAGESQVTMTGAFYAENEIVSAKQNNIAGTSVSNYFDMGGQVPRIYQVPELATNLPKGIPGGPPDWHITTSQWSESTS